MRILLFNEYYPPDTSATSKMAAAIAETLAARHEVTVVAGRPSYDPDEFYSYRLLRRTVRNHVVVECVGSTAYPRHQMCRRASNYLSYLAFAVPRAIFLRSDIVLSMTDPPVAGIAAAFVAYVTGRPFVYNIRDLYPDMAVGGNIVEQGLFVQLWERMHRWALRHAARVIVLGDDMRRLILAKGVAPDRVLVVRDGASIPDSMPPASDPVVQEIRSGFPFVAIHAGNIGFYGAWNTLLKAAELLRDDGTGLVFVGDGANRALLQSTAANSPNVRFVPFRPVGQISHVMMAGDIHIITIRRGLEGTVVPSKLYSTLAAGRPVLAVAPSECDAARIVVESGCGLAVDPDDPAAVAAAIRELRRDPARLSAMGLRAREAASKYLRAAELQRFVTVAEDVVAK